MRAQLLARAFGLGPRPAQALIGLEKAVKNEAPAVLFHLQCGNLWITIHQKSFSLFFVEASTNLDEDDRLEFHPKLVSRLKRSPVIFRAQGFLASTTQLGFSNIFLPPFTALPSSPVPTSPSVLVT